MKDNNSNNIGLQTDNPITEKFHELLAANTKKLNDLRLEYAQRMADAKDEYDKAIEKRDLKYNHEMHNLFWKNCHSHVAYILNLIKYKGKDNYTMVDIWWMLILKGKYISLLAFIKTYLGFFIFFFIIYLAMR